MPLAIPAKSGAERLRPAQLQEDEEDEELEQLQQQLFAADDEDPALVSAWPLVTRMRRFTALSSGGRHAIGSRLPTACLSAHRGQHLAPCHVGPAKFPAWPLTKCCTCAIRPCPCTQFGDSDSLNEGESDSPTSPALAGSNDSFNSGMSNSEATLAKVQAEMEQETVQGDVLCSQAKVGLPDFELLSLVGQGAFGKVRTRQHTHTLACGDSIVLLQATGSLLVLQH